MWRSARAFCLLASGLLGCSVLGCSGAGGGGDADEGPDGSRVPGQYMGTLQGRGAAPADPANLPDAPEGIFVDEAPPPRSATGCGSNLTGILRDFKIEHPDFGDAVADDRGLVQPHLGPDRKPLYKPAGTTVTTSGAANFNQWYRDTPGVNQTVEFTLDFADRGNGVQTFDDQDFFPLDNQLYGNESMEHNFHFTFELHTEFAYRGGEIFTFAGDDDLWVYINGKLVIDLGGVHSTQTDKVDLDARAAELGLKLGSAYPLDLFQAERHASGSTFRVDTSLIFTSCGTILR